MKILVTNDDGIFANGIKEISIKLSEIAEVIVVAPDRERSAIGHAITIHTPLRVEKVENIIPNIETWAINGTPSDCVKIAVESIMNKKPDLIVSGINNGPNLGTDVIYSGTVSAAIEGAIHSIPSVAISACFFNAKINYESIAEISCKIIKNLIKKDLPQNIILNINIPSLLLEKIKGIKITELGIRKYNNNYIKRTDPKGKNYYWLSGELIEIENKDTSDIVAIEEGYISITPLHFDLTAYYYIDELKSWKFKI
ncbi:5'-nucleotidase [Caloranaerobacter sp. TR13]|uniref:5'/3'-nucleotidase SurE n=1 Tax=Caloranaerobacter sp. TR13 TaxID=1302151 RepID=UPI0006D481BF|nr:5'/3'-nucleotidase SurE [Caloranaerobacter sp. TR13]KPU28125.1 5'-nucleotidase [Caloranaerobacter sp. TR13]